MNYGGLERFVDSGSFARGLMYALRGQSSVTSASDEDIEAISSGSNGEIYTEWIEYELEGEEFVHFSGRCTCPVGYNCKHCVSATLTALKLVPPSLMTASQVSRPRTDANSGWRRALTNMLGLEATGQDPIALGFTFTAPRVPMSSLPIWKQQTTGRLEMHSMRKGKRDTWIKTGISLSNLREGIGREFDPRQVRAVRDFLMACELGSGGLFGMREPLSMTMLHSPLLGYYLKGCIDAGVELVDTVTKLPIIIEPEPAVPTINLTDTGDFIDVTAALNHPSDPKDFLLIGKPSQLVFWDDGKLHMAFLEPVASEEWSYLRRKDVRVPTSEQDDFERDFLPALRVTGMIKTDGYELPLPPEPVLRLTLTSSGERLPVVTANWEWAYQDKRGHVISTYPLWSPPGPGRNAEAEQAIRSEASDVVARVCPAMMGERLGWIKLRGEQLLALDELASELAAIGVEVVQDTPTFRRAEDVQVDLDVDESRDWLDLRMRVLVDGQPVELRELLGALAVGQRFTYVGGSYVNLDSPDLARLRALIEEARLLGDARRSELRVPKIRQSWWQDLLDLGIVNASANRWLEAVRNAPEPEPATVPDTLNATLRPYQEVGFGWLSQLRDAGLGGVLADDMGLGKTVQVLAMILRDRERNPGSPWLVVAPTSVVGNWVSEAERFAPTLKVVGIDSTERIRGTRLADEVSGADVVVTSYTLMRLEADDYRALGITGLVLDEAQNVKNAKSKGFAAAASLGAATVFAVTGTPIENNLGELWAMFSLTAPGLLGSAEKFNDAYRKPIEKAASSPDGGGEELMATLRRRIGPFLLRRTKQSVSLDLPPKQEQVLRVELKGSHRRMYDVQLEKERQRVLGLSEEDRIEILSSLTRLRQLAIDPRLADGDSAAPASKLDELLPLLESLVAEHHSALVFSQFTRFLKLVAERLDEAGIPYLYLDGSTRGRPGLIKRFAAGEAPVFLISLKAGGTGLNLTMADYAILTDPWWNPAAEEQAVDRAHRIGQTRPVHVYRLVAEGTIEEKVVALQDQKRRLLGVLSEDGAADGKLSAAELRALLD
ncbi:RNA polymerase-associated protein RapA [Trueperella bernardiae]|uniref:RNA polymerase-associated protein RapA n=1 Tax=Trueperella bernardiae TaxID=59561 RepID=A0A0W1KMH2_9ACTO|nr:DEAD/DEAH box helicase [Trueperella bernardiae]KTF04782.1 RNA polymerase-associated protein RapA [Trueperella bernardiae]